MIDRDHTELHTAATAAGSYAINADVSNPDQVEAMVSEVVATFNDIHALVNNAGVAAFGPISECDFTTWRRVMETNLDGVFLCSQAARTARE